VGWRATTVDVDLRLEPEADVLLRSIADLKERLGINVELAAPPDFIPELPAWRERSPFRRPRGAAGCPSLRSLLAGAVEDRARL